MKIDPINVDRVPNVGNQAGLLLIKEEDYRKFAWLFNSLLKPSTKGIIWTAAEGGIAISLDKSIYDRLEAAQAAAQNAANNSSSRQNDIDNGVLFDRNGNPIPDLGSTPSDGSDGAGSGATGQGSNAGGSGTSNGGTRSGTDNPPAGGGFGGDNTPYDPDNVGGASGEIQYKLYEAGTPDSVPNSGSLRYGRSFGVSPIELFGSANISGEAIAPISSAPVNKQIRNWQFVHQGVYVTVVFEVTDDETATQKFFKVLSIEFKDAANNPVEHFMDFTQDGKTQRYDTRIQAVPPGQYAFSNPAPAAPPPTPPQTEELILAWGSGGIENTRVQVDVTNSDIKITLLNRGNPLAPLSVSIDIESLPPTGTLAGNAGNFTLDEIEAGPQTVALPATDGSAIGVTARLYANQNYYDGASFSVGSPAVPSFDESLNPLVGVTKGISGGYCFYRWRPPPYVTAWSITGNIDAKQQQSANGFVIAGNNLRGPATGPITQGGNSTPQGDVIFYSWGYMGAFELTFTVGDQATVDSSGFPLANPTVSLPFEIPLDQVTNPITTSAGVNLTPTTGNLVSSEEVNIATKYAVITVRAKVGFKSSGLEVIEDNSDVSFRLGPSGNADPTPGLTPADIKEVFGLQLGGGCRLGSVVPTGPQTGTLITAEEGPQYYQQASYDFEYNDFASVVDALLGQATGQTAPASGVSTGTVSSGSRILLSARYTNSVRARISMATGKTAQSYLPHEQDDPAAQFALGGTQNPLPWLSFGWFRIKQPAGKTRVRFKLVTRLGFSATGTYDGGTFDIALPPDASGAAMTWDSGDEGFWNGWTRWMRVVSPFSGCATYLENVEFV